MVDLVTQVKDIAVRYGVPRTTFYTRVDAKQQV